MTSDLIDLCAVEDAAERIHGHVVETPLIHSETLSELTGSELWLKFENLQFTGSFKQRGALNTLLSLSAEERRRGVIAVSAGNHAQGVAYHARQLGIAATIVMPRSTPIVKATRTRALGAEVILEGSDFGEAAVEMERLVAKHGATLVHPFDDDRVIAGQGTVGLEMLAAKPDLDVIVVAIGGGGLISGVAVAARGLRSSAEIVGVQSALHPGMAVATGRWPSCREAGVSMAEGIAVQLPGRRTRTYVDRLVDDVLVVPEERIETALALLLQIEKTLVEGAGAAGLAAVLEHPARFAGRRVGLILSGGNIDNRLLTAVLRRQQVRDGTLFRLGVQLPDRTGALGELCAHVGRMGGNIENVTHDRSFCSTGPKSARVELEVELGDAALRAPIRAELLSRGFLVEGQVIDSART